ncbi:MAG: hypothetical protein HY906_27620 [Deltaproteobacteria bacterium]|nr:hypothetical protein [Deltaproteobacteria bacterium]
MPENPSPPARLPLPEVGAQLLAALGLKQARTEKPKESVDRRDRAFTLLVNACDTFQRAVAYLRWNEGDADAIAPSLFDYRSGR